MLTSIANYGAKGDGRTDDLRAFQRAISEGGRVYVPATASGYRLSAGISIINAGFEGDWFGNDGSYGTKLVFDAGVPACVTIDGGDGNAGGRLNSMLITRSGSPPPGSVGVLVTSCYNVSLTEVMSSNHAKPWRFAADGNTGLGFTGTRLYSSAASDVHIEFDSWPEARFDHCRFGKNGLGDLNCNAYVRFTGGEAHPAQHSGIGPNGIIFNNSHFNQGVNSAARWLTFDSMLGGGYTAGIFGFAQCHVEAAVTGIGSNSGSGMIYRMSLTDLDFNVTGDLFDLDLATAVSELSIINVSSPGGLTLAPTNGIVNLRLLGGRFSGPVSLTGKASSNADLVAGVFAGGLTLAGAWTRCNVIGGAVSSLTNTATGTISVS